MRDKLLLTGSSCDLEKWPRLSKVNSRLWILLCWWDTTMLIVGDNPYTYIVIFSSSLWTLPNLNMHSFKRFRYCCSSSSAFCITFWRFSKTSRIADVVAYELNRYCMSSGQHFIPPWWDDPLRLVRKWVPAVSARILGITMNFCASDMFNISTSLTKRGSESKTLMVYFPSKTWFFRVRFKFFLYFGLWIFCT